MLKVGLDALNFFEQLANIGFRGFELFLEFIPGALGFLQLLLQLLNGLLKLLHSRFIVCLVIGLSSAAQDQAQAEQVLSEALDTRSDHHGGGTLPSMGRPGGRPICGLLAQGDQVATGHFLGLG